MNEEDSFEILFEEIIGYSMCLLYTHQYKDEILKSDFVSNNEQNDFINFIYSWGENESETTFKNLQTKGVSRKDIQNLLDKVKSLQKIIVISPTEEEPMIIIMNTLFIGLMDLIKPIYDDLQKMYDHFPLKNEEFLIDSKLRNPFFILRKLLNKMHGIFDLIDANDDIPFEYLEFSSKFEVLPTIVNEIETEDIKEKDFKILKKNCCLFILEGFVFNQVWVKLDEEQLQDTKKKWLYSTIQKDEHFQLCSEYDNLVKYWNQLYNLNYKYNEKEMKNLYKKYSKNEDISNYIKPLVDEIIPFLNKTRESNEILKITFEISKKYQSCLKELSNGKEQLYDKELIVLFTYFPILQFELIESPDPSYEVVFFEIMNSLNFAFIKNSILKVQIPEKLNEPKKVDTLIQQKYSVVYKMLKCLRDCGKESISNDDVFLIFSLLSWKINVDSKEARDLEEYLNKSIELHLLSYDYENNDLRFYAKYVIEKVHPSSSLLNQNDLDKNFSKFASKSIKEGSSTCSACCDIQ